MPLLEAFPRVLVQDSSCFGIDPLVAASLPEAYQTSGRSGSARLQLVLEIKRTALVAPAVEGYRCNDQRHAADALAWTQPGDLLLRDLGYFSLKSLAALAQRQVYFVSRLFYRVEVSDPKTHRAIDLVALTKGRRQLDLQMCIGDQERLPVRVVGFRLSQRQAERRLRKACRDGRNRMSKRYRRWSAWEFFITNVLGLRWPSPDGKSDFVLYTTPRGRHEWLNQENSGLSANEVMWAFFQK